VYRPKDFFGKEGVFGGGALVGEKGFSCAKEILAVELALFSTKKFAQGSTPGGDTIHCSTAPTRFHTPPTSSNTDTNCTFVVDFSSSRILRNK